MDRYTHGYISLQIIIWHTVTFFHPPISNSDHTSLLHYFVVLRSVFWLYPLITHWHEPKGKHLLLSKNECLLVRYLATNILLLLRAYASEMCLSSRSLAMDICVTVIISEHTILSLGMNGHVGYTASGANTKYITGSNWELWHCIILPWFTLTLYKKRL